MRDFCFKLLERHALPDLVLIAGDIHSVGIYFTSS